jgi:chaperonin cofactor prefoldin
MKKNPDIKSQSAIYIEEQKERIGKQADASAKRTNPSSKKFKKLQDMFKKKYKPTEGVC